MPDLYLIAHKVRGEPAFDVAIKLQIGSEEGWIIPTSGHRAYPFWQTQIDDLLFEDMPEMPPDLPDHYHAERNPNYDPEAAPIGQGKIKDLVSLLRIGEAKSPIPIDPSIRRV